MQKKRLLSLILVLAMCLSLVPSTILAAEGDPDPATAIPIFEDPSYTFEERAADLVARMDLEQKGSQLISEGSAAIPANQLEGGTLDVPATRGVESYNWWGEALHGYSKGTGAGGSVNYPQNTTAGSTWNPDLYYNQATQIGQEIRERTNTINDGKGQKNLTFYSPTVNMQRDPRWGRNEEAYSEDVLLNSLMGTRFVQGMEGKDKNGVLLDTEKGYYNAITTVKHYVANNSENNRLNGGATTDLRALREYYAAPYRNVIQDADVSSVMTAYSTLNGEPSSISSYLMDTLLRQTYGFSGYITSDCDSVSTISRHNYTNPHTGETLTWIEQLSQALQHGEDLECNGGHGGSSNNSYRARITEMIGSAVDTDMGVFTENAVDIATHRLMTARMKTGEFDDNSPYTVAAAERKAQQASNGETNRTAERLDIADKVATEGVVMLKNEGMLPIEIDEDTNIVVVGAWQTNTYTGLYSSGSSSLNIQKGIEDAVKKINSNATLTYITSNSLTAANEETIRNADYVIVVVGTPDSYSREDSDRSSIALPSGLDTLISRVGQLNDNTVAVMETCGSMEVKTFEDDVNAILWSSYQGTRKVGFGNIITGAANPSGKTTSTWYESNSDIADIYDYNLYATDGSKGRTYMYYEGPTSYPFGYGLSYTTFAYSDLVLDKTTYDANDTITATFTVKNTGDVDGMEVAQLYVAQPEADAALNRPIRRLAGFEKIELAAGESKEVTIEVAIIDLAYYNEAEDCFKVDTGLYQIQVGTNSAAADLTENLNVSGAINVKPAVLSAKPNQGGDKDKGIEHRLIFDKGQTVNPQLTVAMNDESLYGYIIADQKSPITQLSSKDFPAGTLVTYESNNSEVVSVEGDTIKTVGIGVATVTATLTYNGESVSTDFVVYVENTPYPENITINGEKINGFQNKNFNYSIAVDSPVVPDVVAVANEEILAVDITKPEKLPGIVTVTTTNRETEESVTYNIGVGTEPDSADFKTKPDGWTAINENENAEFGENGLTITTEQGVFGSETEPNNVYMQSAMGDWIAQTKVTATPSESNQQAGMIIYNDDENHIRFVYEYPTSGTSTVIRAYRVNAGTQSQLATANLSAAAVTMQVVKQGTSYQLRYTTDGVAWNTLTTVSLSYACPQIGVIATNGASEEAEAMTANFDGMAIYPLSYLYPRATNISVEGLTIAFNPETFVYNILVKDDETEAPVINASPGEGLTVTYEEIETATGTAKVFISSPVASTTYTLNFGYGPKEDYFADGDFNEDLWNILNEANTASEYYRLDKGVGLLMPTQRNDIYTNGANWKNAFVMPAMGNWEVITKVFYPQIPTANYQQAMVLVWQDDNNYIRLNCQTSSLQIEPIVELNGTVGGSGLNGARATAASDNTVTIYFKIRKTNNDYALAWSQDGTNFNDIGTASNVVLNNPHIGLFVSQNSSSAAVELGYEYVSVTSIEGVNDAPGAYLERALNNVADYVMADLGTSVEETARELTFSKVPRDYEVSFTSSNENVIAADGSITHDEYVDEEVELSVIIKDNNTGLSETRNVTITVPMYKIVKDIKTSEEPGVYTDTVEVELTTGTEGATIRYTTDGSDPTTSETAVTYTAPINVDDTMVIKAVGTKAEYDDSNIATFEYKIYESKLMNPTTNVESGSILTGETMIELTAEEGAEIRYTIDGSTPTADSALYTGPIMVNRIMTIKAIALMRRHEPSDIASYTYLIATNLDDAGDTPPGPGRDDISLAEEYEDYFPIGTFGGHSAGDWIYQGNVSAPANDLKLVNQIGSNNTNSLTRQAYVAKVAEIEANTELTEEERAEALQLAHENIVLDSSSQRNGKNELNAIRAWNQANPDKIQKKARAHVLAWHGPQQPRWFFCKDFTYSDSIPYEEQVVDPDTMLARLDNYIKLMMEDYSEYNDIIIAWDVVNEAVDDYTGQIRNHTDAQFGNWGTVFRRPDLDDNPDARLEAESAWIRQAFKSARKWSNEYDCDWTLYYNDYQDSNKSYEPKMSQTIKMLSYIDDDDIDGYGMQGRLSYAYPSMEMLRDQITRALDETGCTEFAFSEGDIRSDFIPNPNYDPDQPSRRVVEGDRGWEDGTDSGSWSLRSNSNGNTFDTNNSPVMRDPDWGTGQNYDMAKSPEKMAAQADYAADLMQLILDLDAEGYTFSAYQWDGHQDSSTFNGQTGCTMWDNNGNPKYSFYAVAGAPTLFELKNLLKSVPDDSEEVKYSVVSWTAYQNAKTVAETIVEDTRIYTEDDVYAAKAAKESLQQAIDGLKKIVPETVNFLTKTNTNNVVVLNQSSSRVVDDRGLLLTMSRGTIMSDTNVDDASNLNNPQDLVLVNAQGDWTATVKVNDAGSGAWYYGYFNFLAMDDYDNHIGFLVGDGSVDVKWEKDGVQDGLVVDNTDNITNTPYYRITKSEDNYKFFSSRDGATWKLIEEVNDTGLFDVKLALDCYGSKSFTQSRNLYVEYIHIMDDDNTQESGEYELETISKSATDIIPSLVVFPAGSATVQLPKLSGYTVTYISDNENIITTDGVVTAPEETTVVSIIFVISNGISEYASAPINVTVSGQAFKVTDAVLTPDSLSKVTGDITATVTLENTSSIDQEGMMILALYDSDGAMVNYGSVGKVVASGATEKFEVRFRAPFNESNYEGYVAKVMVWDGDSMATTSGTPISGMTVLDQ